MSKISYTKYISEREAYKSKLVENINVVTDNKPSVLNFEEYDAEVIDKTIEEKGLSYKSAIKYCLDENLLFEPEKYAEVIDYYKLRNYVKPVSLI